MSELKELGSQTTYWNAAAAAGTKQFAHPLHRPWLEDVSRNATLLDYGCGYGRIMNDLAQQGFNNLAGVDTSPTMIAQARQRHPAMQFTTLDRPPKLPMAAASVDVILLFAVLTCIPEDQAQRSLIGELTRVLKPNACSTSATCSYRTTSATRTATPNPPNATAPTGYSGPTTAQSAATTQATGSPPCSQDWTPSPPRHITVPTMNGYESEGLQLLTHKRTPNR
ncbi:class I SAM-dependent methyltransferase [Streptomyces phaeochromogenes]|uniref:class I SAM-dependent methyltransferase n=1 Tax=Streptomyces phaeochromogenes TaxID=1923 RepID=UPI003869EF1B|nr:class I SAM-dependent methyltransferase [Streptomyces phaeochromogenes]